MALVDERSWLTRQMQWRMKVLVNGDGSNDRRSGDGHTLLLLLLLLRQPMKEEDDMAVIVDRFAVVEDGTAAMVDGCR